MNIFENMMNVDISAVRTMCGAGVTTGASREVMYFPIDMEQMRTIRSFYNEEPAISAVNKMKNSFSTTHRSVKLQFLGEDLDDSKYGIIDSLLSLAEEARGYYDMFGFVAIFNPMAWIEQRVENEDLDEEDQLSEKGQHSTGGVFESMQPVFKETIRLLNSLDMKRADAIATELGVVGDSFDTNPKKTARIETMDRVTEGQGPSARLVLSENGKESKKRAQSETTSNTAKRTRKQVRTLEETLVHLRELRIVSLEQGQFFLEVDRLSGARRIVFERSTGDAMRAAATNLETRTGLGSVKIDPSVYVHVWSNMMPEEDCRFKTGIYEVIRLRRRVDEVDANVAAANHARTRRLVLIETEIPKHLSDQDNMTDAEIFGASESTVNPSKQADREQEIRNEIFALAQNQYLNGKAQSNLMREIGSGRLGQNVRKPDGSQAYIQAQTTDLLVLPQMLKVSNANTMPDVIDNTDHQIFIYRQALASKLGIPMNIMDGGGTYSGRVGHSGKGKTGVSTTAAVSADSDKRLRAMVLSDREILAQVVNNVWDMMYRSIDNKMLSMVLSRSVTDTRRKVEQENATVKQLMQQAQSVTDLALREVTSKDIENRISSIVALNARLRQIDTKIRDTLALPYRFTIIFTNLSYMSMQELDYMKANHALSALEHANAVRVANNMNELSQAEFDKLIQDETKAELDREEQTMKLTAKYAPKPTTTSGFK